MEEYEQISDHIFSLAPGFGFLKDLEHELEWDEHGKTTEVSRLHEEYDEQVAWEELVEWLGERDFQMQHTREECHTMSEDDHREKRMQCEQAWADEFEHYGIERMTVVKLAKELGDIM